MLSIIDGATYGVTEVTAFVVFFKLLGRGCNVAGLGQ